MDHSLFPTSAAHINGGCFKGFVISSKCYRWIFSESDYLLGTHNGTCGVRDQHMHAKLALSEGPVGFYLGYTHR